MKPMLGLPSPRAIETVKTNHRSALKFREVFYESGRNSRKSVAVGLALQARIALARVLLVEEESAAVCQPRPMCHSLADGTRRRDTAWARFR